MSHNIKKGFLLTSILTCATLVACSSGGGGGGNGGASDSNLRISIRFPTPVSDGADRYGFGSFTSLTVSGTVTDVVDGSVSASDITSVKVNGVTATLDASDPSRWSASIPINAGNNTLEATVNSANGTHHTVNQVFLNQPAMNELSSITLDLTNNRAFVLDKQYCDIFEVSLLTGIRDVFSSSRLNVGSGPGCTDGTAIDFDATNNRLLISDYGFNDGSNNVSINGHFIAVDLNSRDRSYFSSSSQGVGTGSASTDFAYGIIADPSNNRALGFVRQDNLDNQHFIAMDEVTGDRTILQSNIYYYIAQVLDLANNRTITLQGSPGRSVSSIDLTNGTVTDISPWSLPDNRLFTPTGIDYDATTGTAYVTDRDAVIETTVSGSIRHPVVMAVDTTTGIRSILSTYNVGNGLELSSPEDIKLDTANNRAIVIDSGLNGVMSVDLTSGDRSVLSGAVPQMGNPDNVIADTENDRLFVLDLANSSIIYEVDLSTRAIRVVSSDSVGTGVSFNAIEDIALDSINNRLIALSAPGLIEVDIDTGNRNLLSGQDGGGPIVGNGSLINDSREVAIDTQTNTAYVLDGLNDQLWEVNLTNGDRSVLSSATASTGHFTDPTDMILDTANSIAYVAENDPASRAIIAVDLTNGNRSILSDNNGVGAGSNFGSNNPFSISLDPDDNRIYFSNGNLIRYVDTATGDRFDLPYHPGGPLTCAGCIEKLAVDATNNLVFFAERNYPGILIIDAESGAKALVAQ